MSPPDRASDRGRRRSLSRSGGDCELVGDTELARVLARCLDVDPQDEMPFTHGFHAYPARMHPETARRVIEAFPAGRMLDPFVGSGTTALEAVRIGARFTGLDISPVAIEVAWSRTRGWPPDECRRVEREGHRVAGRASSLSARPIDLPPWARDEREWHSPHTLREIVLLKALIDGEDAPLSRLHRAVLSSIVVKLSRQRSDSDPRPDPHFRPRPRGATFRLFGEKCSELTRNLLRLSSDLHKRGVRFVDPDLRIADARTEPLPQVDLVITSPPYAGTYDYARHHARRFPLFGGEAEGVAGREIGPRRAPDAYRGDLARCLKNILAAIATGGRMLMLIGDGNVKGNLVRADRLVAELAGDVVAVASQRRRDWSGGTPRREHLILVKKPV